ncbi:MAG TPA: hypothetical protein VF792_00350 [Ktedonobacterales bacterium]
MNYTPCDNPITSINWRRHRRGCPHYRERWYSQSELQLEQPMYQVFCGMNTPPGSIEEQEKCLSSKTRCWRLENRAGKDAMRANQDPIPMSSIKRRPA